MPRTPTTPAQIDGHRFLMRRIEHALVRADSKMLHDPLRTRNRAAVVGLMLVVVLGVGTAIMGLIRPHSADSIRNNIVTVADSRAMYVRLNEQLHPVVNLASARLIVGSPETPQKVSQKALDGADIGFPLGIPSAPDVSDKQDLHSVNVGICDLATTNLHHPMVVSETIARIRTGDVPTSSKTTHEELTRNLVTEFAGEHWVIADGVRARIDVGDPVVTRALGITPDVIRPVSGAFLRAIPEVAPIRVPTIPALGEQTGFPVPFDRIGNVVAVGEKQVVVLGDGAAEVSPVVAEMLRAMGSSTVATTQELAAVAVTSPLTVEGVPSQVPTWNRDDGWICADSDTNTTVVSSPAGINVDGGADAGAPVVSFPEGHISFYPHADGSGSLVDGFVGTTGLSTIAVLVDGAPHLISASGVRHKVENRHALAALGFESETPLPALPWRVVVALREGAELTHESALSPVG